jgi:hypothetical protein
MLRTRIAEEPEVAFDISVKVSQGTAPTSSLNWSFNHV